MKKTVLKKSHSRVYIPGSKSVTNRALLLASLTPEDVVLKNPLVSDDTISMIKCLRELGIKVTAKKDTYKIQGTLFQTKNKLYTLNAGLSGTTMRFLLPILCVIPGEKVLTGEAGLLNRPIKELVDALSKTGAEITYLDKKGYPPLLIGKSKINKNELIANGSRSSQYISSLLMLLPSIGGGVVKVSSNLVSRPYVDLTLQLMEEFGVNVRKQKNNSFLVPKNRTYTRKTHLSIEGDFSSACYFAALAAITSSTVELRNMNPKSKQADRKFLAILKNMGNTIHAHESSIVVEGRTIKPVTVDMESCPDQVQTLAVLAAFAKGKTIVTGIQTLKLKETDRLKAIRQELKKMGIKTSATQKTLTIYGGDPKCAVIETYGDHRMAMSFAIAGRLLPDLKIKNPEVVTKTFPEFWQKLEKIKI